MSQSLLVLALLLTAALVAAPGASAVVPSAVKGDHCISGNNDCPGCPDDAFLEQRVGHMVVVCAKNHV